MNILMFESSFVILSIHSYATRTWSQCDAARCRFQHKQVMQLSMHVVFCILEIRENGEIKHGKKDARNLCVSRQLQKMCEMCMLMVSH